MATDTSTATTGKKAAAGGGASDFARKLTGGGNAGGSNAVGPNSWKSIPATWTTQQIKDYQNVLYKAGAYGTKLPILGVWNQNVDGTAFKQALGYVNPKSDNPTVTSWANVMESIRANPDTYKQAFGGAGNSITNGTRQLVSTSVNNISDTDANSYIETNFMKVHGRMPNDVEKAGLRDKLKAAISANASKTVTTDTYENGKLVKSAANSTGGINPNQFILQTIREQAPQTIKSDRASGLSDTAAMNLQAVTKTAADYGIMVPDQHLLDMTDSVSKGKVQMADIENYLKNVAAGAYPAYADQILKQGMTVSQIAAPKIGTVAKLLELDPADVNLNHPLVKASMQYTDSNGQPAVQPIYKLENAVRNTPEWLQTNNAKQTIMGGVMQTARDMGVAY
jgi:uncharacterized protein (DUF1778 family)